MVEHQLPKLRVAGSNPVIRSSISFILGFKMGRIYTIGETLLDIFFKDDQPFASRPGGAMLNTAVSLGRLGLPVSLITEYAHDQIGQSIDKFLSGNGVQTDLVYRFEQGKTALAMAFLNQENDATYTFYKQYPEERLIIDMPEFAADDIVLFGSFYALSPAVRKPIMNMLNNAHEAGALIIYDPNIRSPHKKRISKHWVAISENFNIANIVRGSDEDFNTIFDFHDHTEAFNEVQKHGSQCLIYTMNKDGIHLLYDHWSHYYRVPVIETVSTVGAGDSFNAGLIYAIWKNKINRQKLPALSFESWSMLIEEGIRFAADVCQSMDNYISTDFVKSLKQVH